MILHTILFSTLALLLQQTFAQSPISTTTNPSACPSPTGFANTLIRAPVPQSPKLKVTDTFLFANNLFFYTDQNTALSSAAIASFCLDQCISYQPDPFAIDLPSNGPLPPVYISNKAGPCLSFTVDMGKPAPPNPNDNATRWYCEGFSEYFKDDLSDFVPVDAPGSYMYGLAVNRACGGGYRAF